MKAMRGTQGWQKSVSLSVCLESASWRRLFVLFVVLISGGFAWGAARVWIAAEFAASTKPELWRRAIQWEPDNAGYWARLGWMEAWDFEGGDLERAAADYERAVAANPHSDHHWLELAGVYERRGQASQARAAYERAQYNHPISPVVAWRYGNFLLRQGNASEAFGQFRRALLRDPGLTENAVAAWWKTGLSTTEPVGQLLPAENSYYFQALNYFARQNEFDSALRVWDELLKLKQPFPLPQALTFIDELIFAGRVTDAQRLWYQALDVSEWPHEAQSASSLVFNGGFEQDFANGGFDWREQESPDVSYAFDTAVVHSGSRSLKVSFCGGSNLNFQHVFQYVAVEPGRRYRLTGYLRSAAVSTDSGIRFLLWDPLHPAQPQILTEGLTGTQPWTRMEAEFVTRPETRLLGIMLRRKRSLKFDNKFAGTLWVDDVSLVEVSDSDHPDRRR